MQHYYLEKHVSFNPSIIQVHKCMFAVILQWIHTPALWRSDIDIITMCEFACTGGNVHYNSFIAKWDNSTRIISTSSSTAARVKELECVHILCQYTAAFLNTREGYKCEQKYRPTSSSKYLSYFAQHSLLTTCVVGVPFFPISHFPISHFPFPVPTFRNLSTFQKIPHFIHISTSEVRFSSPRMLRRRTVSGDIVHTQSLSSRLSAPDPLVREILPRLLRVSCYVPMYSVSVGFGVYC